MQDDAALTTCPALCVGALQGAHAAFALLLDSTLDAGQSRPIATYGSPSLTTAQVFQVRPLSSEHMLAVRHGWECLIVCACCPLSG